MVEKTTLLGGGGGRGMPLDVLVSKGMGMKLSCMLLWAEIYMRMLTAKRNWCLFEGVLDPLLLGFFYLSEKISKWVHSDERQRNNTVSCGLSVFRKGSSDSSVANI